MKEDFLNLPLEENDDLFSQPSSTNFISDTPNKII